MIFLPTPENLQKAAALLKKEDVLAFPTETVYGIGGLARSDGAVSKIFKTKGRPFFNPLIVHVDSLNQAKEVGVLDTLTEEIVSLFWPGPLTVIVPINPNANLSPLTTAGLATVAIRFSSHPILLRLLALVQEPLVAPSANPSGFLTATTAPHVEKAFPSLFVLDGGETEKGVESTIIQVVDGQITLLRPGAIPKEEIEDMSGTPVVESQHQTKITSPGQTLHHYAPVLPLRINVDTPNEDEAFLAFGKTKGAPSLNLSRAGCLQEAAHNLFSYLHILDNPQRYKGIAVAPIPNEGVGVALNDRLRRAAQSFLS